MFKWFFAGTEFFDNPRIFWNLLESLGNWESHLCYHYWVYWYWFDQDLSCHFVYLHHLFHFGKLRMFEHQHWQYWYHKFLGNLVGLNLENKRDGLQGNCQILSFQSISMSKIIWYMAYIIDDVSWVLEFLTCGYNISLVLSKKMNGLQGNCCILWIDKTSKSIFNVKNCILWV